jgi:hypothetical protein
VQQWTDGGGEGVLIADVDEVKKIPTDSVDVGNAFFFIITRESVS